MSSGKKALIIILAIVLIVLVVVGFSSRGDKEIDEGGVIAPEPLIDDGGLFDDDPIFDDGDEDAPRRETGEIDDEIDDLEKRIEEVLRLFDPLPEQEEL